MEWLDYKGKGEKMRFMKQTLAIALAILLMLPVRPVLADDYGLWKNNAEESAKAETIELETAETETAAPAIAEIEAEASTITETVASIAETAAAIAETTKETAETIEETAKAESTEEETQIEETETERGEPPEEETTAAEIMESIAETVAAIVETWAVEIETETDTFAADTEVQNFNDFGIATPNNVVRPEIVKTTGDEVKFNTGNHVWSVVSYEDFWENAVGDGYFEEDGSYTINIPEENPFFPYEVQFIYKGQKINKWFMTPDDHVEVGGHTFYVSAYFDDTAITQMSLGIAGDTVVVYPEKKRFTDDGDGTSVTSLLPLQERELEIDLSAYTPVELTMVSVNSIFTGSNALENTDKLMWAYGENGSYYRVSQEGGYLNLSRGTYNNTDVKWQMIVGEDNQLTEDNIRYILTAKVTNSKDWIRVSMFKQDAQGNREKISSSAEYTDHASFVERLDVTILDGEKGEGDNFYIGLEFNEQIFPNPDYDEIRIYDGYGYSNGQVVKQGEDITSQLLGKVDVAGGGFLVKGGMNKTIHMVSYSSGKVTGWLRMYIRVRQRGLTAVVKDMYDGTGEQRTSVVLSTWGSGREVRLKSGYAAEKEYYTVVCLKNNGVEYTPVSAAAYKGHYSSIEEAVKAGAEDISDLLFSEEKGYKADYSQSVEFTIFTEISGSIEDGTLKSEKKYWCPITVIAEDDSVGTDLLFSGLKDEQRNDVPCYLVGDENDSYGEYNYPTFLVDENVNLKKLAPVWNEKNQRVYAAGGNTPEVSGQSLRDFSKGPVQYTVISENGKTKNYWVQAVKKTDGQGRIYINSLADKAAKTYEKDGVIYSTREMFLSDWYNYEHIILLVNMGTQDIPDLKAELVSDVVQLNSYWTLKGGYSLAGFGPVQKDGVNTPHGELPNLARLCIEPKDDIEIEYEENEDGSVEWVKDISGTLTIKSGDKVLMVLALTGIVGDPGFTTEEIPDGVKYVPYGTMIQNSNKYSQWEGITYNLTGGKLPAGMRLLPNGELYGVPTETGEFTFTVHMKSTREVFEESERTFTFTVTENTDANVEVSTDPGYELTQRVPDITMSAVGDYTMVSKGEYEEFVDVFLDGEKLARGTDYTSEAGSTRITIRSQTLKRSNKTGIHTLGIEFRTKNTKILKRAAQNFRITGTGSSGNSGGTSSGSSNSSGSSGGGSSSSSRIYKDPKKGYVHKDTGIITDGKSGYSHWQQDEKGWKLIYADKTVAAGYMTVLETKETVEQIIWEKVNGSWYAFGADGYLKSGWVYDYRLGRWYMLSVNTGMAGGWYKDPVDQHTYYLDPVEGGMSTGWRTIDSKWYYFNTKVTGASWELNKETNKWQYNAKQKSKPLGAMLYNEKTPDGYYVNADGVWDGKKK